MRHPNRYPYCGRMCTVNELMAFAAEGLTRDMLAWRLEHSDMSVEEALMKPPKARKKFILNGQEYTIPGLLPFCEDGVSYKMLKNRLYKGWPVEKAIRKDTKRDIPAPKPVVKPAPMAVPTGKDPEMFTIYRWMRQNLFHTLTTMDGEELEGLKRTGEHTIALEREYYRWEFTFNMGSSDIFTVTCVFRKTGAVSWPKRVYRAESGRFIEMAQYDRNGRDILPALKKRFT